MSEETKIADELPKSNSLKYIMKSNSSRNLTKSSLRLSRPNISSSLKDLQLDEQNNGEFNEMTVEKFPVSQNRQGNPSMVGQSSFANVFSTLKLSFSNLPSFASMTGLGAGLYMDEIDNDAGKPQEKPQFENVPDDNKEEVGMKSNGASVKATTANLANNMIGSGLILLPYAMKLCGLISGLILMVIMGLISMFTLSISVYNSKLSGRFVFKRIINKAFGPNVTNVINIMTLFYSFLLMSAYIVIVRDYTYMFTGWFASDPLNPPFFLTRNFMTSILVLGFMLPLALFKDMKALAFSSVIALIGIATTVLTVFIQFFQKAFTPDHFSNTSFVWFKFNMELFEAVPIMLFAFSAHININTFYRELGRRSVSKMNKVIGSAVGINFLFYSFVSVLGYLSFGILTKDNILTNFEDGSVLTYVARIAMTLVICCSYPIVSFGARVVILNLLPPQKRTDGKYIRIVAVILVIFSLFLGLMVESVSFIIGFCGATIGCFISFIQPPLTFLRLSKRKAKKFSKLRICSFCMIVVGLLILLFSLFMWYKKWFMN
eukprot:TRINITY_DN2153_c0_g1_i1.p1 TRINITY_DN2153_c0_g1~~TRINITY_DN2153_c0_g1_i1.p1  ORF type:complete len:562 (+),score=112.42 TRINITY_DN2153_c0_g1_i1:51-1688(+)